MGDYQLTVDLGPAKVLRELDKALARSIRARHREFRQVAGLWRG
jgi:hypothetical protein